MALNICYEALIRAVLVLFKIALDNWFYALGFLVFAYITHKTPWLQGLIGAVANFLADSTVLLSFAGPIAFIFSLIAKVALKAAFSTILGLIWMMIVFSGKGNLVLKLFSAPVFFIAGVLWGLFPIPGPISIVLPYFFREDKMANAVMIIAIVGFVLLGLFFSDWFCIKLNEIAQFLQ